MTLEEYILHYDELSVKEMTKIYNEFTVDEWLDFLEVGVLQENEDIIRFVGRGIVEGWGVSKSNVKAFWSRWDCLC